MSINLTGTASIGYFSSNTLTGTVSTNSSITSYNSGIGTLTIGSTASNWYHSGIFGGSNNTINSSWIDYQNQIDSLKELLNILLTINEIEIDLDDFIMMDKSERIIAIRDIKIKKILPHEPK